MHRACVDRGLAVYLEKPPTLDCEELERMIAAEILAARQTVVAFNFIIEPERLELKRRLVAGEFGDVQRVGVLSLTARNAAYFARADWSGRLKKDDRLVLDSCIGNAMAHQVHNALFWCGSNALWAWGEINEVSAELYRAHAIEGTDTAFVSATTAQGVTLRVGMTHACYAGHGQGEYIVCEQATIRFFINNSGPDGTLYSLTWNDGRVETGMSPERDLLEMNFKAYGAYLRGQTQRPASLIADCRPFVHLNNLAYLAARHITKIVAPHVRHMMNGYLEVDGLEEAIYSFVNEGRFPSAQGYPWAQPGGKATLGNLPLINEVVCKMIELGAHPNPPQKGLSSRG
jgi:predicted dehydrogenase